MTYLPTSERIANFVFGINVWAWALLVIIAAPEDQRTCLVRWCIALLHGAVGLLFLRRRPAVRLGSPFDVIKALPSIVLSGLAFSHAPPCNQWHTAPQLLFAIGAGLAVVAFASLGRNFAIFPAVREICLTGPYRLVRHPAYAGELLLVAACFLARIDAIGFAILFASTAAVIVRVKAEESLLNSPSNSIGSAYARYSKNVRFRLIPGLW